MGRVGRYRIIHFGKHGRTEDLDPGCKKQLANRRRFSGPSIQPFCSWAHRRNALDWHFDDPRRAAHCDFANPRNRHWNSQVARLLDRRYRHQRILCCRRFAEFRLGQPDTTQRQICRVCAGSAFRSGCGRRVAGSQFNNAGSAGPGRPGHSFVCRHSRAVFHYLAGINSKALWSARRACGPHRHQLECRRTGPVRFRAGHSRYHRSITISELVESGTRITDGDDQVDAAMAGTIDAGRCLFRGDQRKRRDFIHAIQLAQRRSVQNLFAAGGFGS